MLSFEKIFKLPNEIPSCNTINPAFLIKMYRLTKFCRYQIAMSELLDIAEVMESVVSVDIPQSSRLVKILLTFVLRTIYKNKILTAKDMKMKALIICILLTGVFSSAYSQTSSPTVLKDPEIYFDRNWSERCGTFLVFEYNRIRLSEVSCDDIKQLKGKTENLSSQSSKMQRTIDELKRTVNDLIKKIDKLEDITEQQSRKIYDLERKK